MTRGALRLAAVTCLLAGAAPSTAVAEIWGQLSLVGRREASSTIDAANPGVAMEFAIDRPLQVANLLLLADVSGGGTSDAQYTVGIKPAGGPGGGPGSGWVLHVSGKKFEAGSQWSTNNEMSGELNAGTWFVALEYETGSRNSVQIVATRPEVNRRPSDQTPAARSLWRKRPDGSWTRVDGLEPVFVVQFQDDEATTPIAYPPSACPEQADTSRLGRVEGNPYGERVSLLLDATNGAEQHFLIPRSAAISKIDLLLENVTTPPALELKVNGATFVTEALVDTGENPFTCANCPAARWYSGLFANAPVSVAVGATPAPATLVVRGGAARWVASGAASAAASPCFRLARAGFQGGHARVTVTSGLMRQERWGVDAGFRLTLCPTWYPDVDGDGWGDDSSPGQTSCVRPEGPPTVSIAGDCDDTSASVQPGSQESCDGLDNDCDGEADEAPLASLPACPLTGGVCAGARQRCGTVGPLECGLADYLAISGGAYETVESLCDGLDNDCDGEVDEPGTLVPTACGLTAGVCRGTAREICEGTSGWRDCTEEDYGPDYESASPETRCDGKDNDCNGAVDDLAPSRFALCPKQEGVCAGARPRCEGARVVECDDGAYALANPAFEVCESSCDGLDNDCDGVADPMQLCPRWTDSDRYSLGGCGCHSVEGAALGVPLAAFGIAWRSRRRRGDRRVR